MPVRRFHSIEEMPDETWLEPGSAALEKAIRSVWDFSERTCPRHFPRGVHKHRSIESLWETEERWDLANFVAFWAARGGVPDGDGRPRA
jgi:hypothetical protein